MNIVSIALQYLGPALIGKLASGLGVNQSIAEMIVKAAVPTILASLATKAAKPDGARGLFDVLAKQDTGLLGRLSSVLGSPQQKTIAEQGSNALGSLLGTSSLGTLVNAVSKYSGGGASATGGIIGMLAPIVLGTLSQQQKSASLDAGGMAKLLSDQKSNISAAIPGDLAKLLSGSGLLDSVMPKAAATTAPTTSRVPSSASTYSTTTTAGPAKPFNGWPWAGLVAVASLMWGALFSGPPAPWSSIPAPPRLMAGSTDVAGELDTQLKGLHGLLSGVKDRTTAEQALPGLRAAQTSIDRLEGAAKQLPPDNKKMLAAYVANWIPLLTPILTSLAANSNVAPLLKPVLDGVRGRLEAMAKG